MTDYPTHMADLKVEGESIDLTGRLVENCQFTDCTLELRQELMARTHLKDCLFIGCAYIGDGWQWIEIEPVTV